MAPVDQGFGYNSRCTKAVITQNNLVLVNSKGKAIGTLGSTPQTHRYRYNSRRETLYGLEKAFTFTSKATIRVGSPHPGSRLQSQSERIVISLEDGRAGRGDFNDLVVHAKDIREPKAPQDVQTAWKQRTTFDGLLNLNWLTTRQQLTLKTLKNTDEENRIGLVKVSHDKVLGYSVNGVNQATPRAFRQALRDNLIEPAQHIQDGKAISQRWDLSGGDAGLYAPVLITDDDLVFSFGRSSAADGEQHLKVLGENVFGFEDDLAGRGCDWHYDDVIVSASLS